MLMNTLPAVLITMFPGPETSLEIELVLLLVQQFRTTCLWPLRLKTLQQILLQSENSLTYHFYNWYLFYAVGSALSYLPLLLLLQLVVCYWPWYTEMIFCDQEKLSPKMTCTLSMGLTQSLWPKRSAITPATHYKRTTTNSINSLQ